MVVCRTWCGDKKPVTTDDWCKYVVRLKGKYQRGINVLTRSDGQTYFLGYIKEYEEGKIEIIELTSAMVRRENIDPEALKEVAKEREVVSV